jgi:hypothetical protein
VNSGAWKSRLAFLVVTTYGGREVPREPLVPVLETTPLVAASDAEVTFPEVASDARVSEEATPSSPAGPRETHRIISIRIIGIKEMALTVLGGSRLGISERWEATLVDSDDRPVEGKVRIVSVERDHTNLRAVVHLTRDQVKGMRVRLSPRSSIIKIDP